VCGNTEAGANSRRPFRFPRLPLPAARLPRRRTPYALRVTTAIRRHALRSRPALGGTSLAIEARSLAWRLVMKRKKPISPRVHGMLDYGTSAAVAVMPRLMNFPAPARRLCDSLAGGYTALSAV